MKMRNAKLIIFIALLMALVSIITLMYTNAKREREGEANILLLPSLPRPIAKEYALITSAGQSTDAYIVYDTANKLMIHNYFMPQAEEMDLEGANTLVFAVGYSSIGERLHETGFDDEWKRVAALVEKAKKSDMTIITVYLGGEHTSEKNTEELLKLVIPQSDYIIATETANDDSFLSELVSADRIPITFINSPRYLSEPFASAFR